MVPRPVQSWIWYGVAVGFILLRLYVLKSDAKDVDADQMQYCANVAFRVATKTPGWRFLYDICAGDYLLSPNYVDLSHIGRLFTHA